MRKKLIAISMALILSLNLFPVNIFQKTVHAATYVSNVSKIGNPVEGGDNDNWSGNYIYFGNYPQSDASGATKEPIRWRVLDINNTAWIGGDDRSEAQANGFAYNTGSSVGTGDRQNAPVGGNGILLYSDVALDVKQYHPTLNNDEINKLCWGGNGGGSGKGCTLWAWLNDYGNSDVLASKTVPDSPFLTNAFTIEEQSVIMNTKVYSEDLYNIKNASSYAESDKTSLTEDKIFLLSFNEMINSSYGFTNTAASSNTRSFVSSNYSNNSTSWLRSPGYHDSTAYAAAAYLRSNGNIFPQDSYYTVINNFAICPALNLNTTSVILASNATDSGDGGKSSAVSSAPATFSLPTGTGNDYKLTMKTSDRTDFSASESSQNGNEIIISYSGAKTGSNEYISCLIPDKNDKANVKYYGKLKQLSNSSATSGTVTLKLPDEFSDFVDVVLFNEQCNGDKKTDWCSNLVELSVSLKITPTVTAPTAKNLTYNKSAQELVNAGSTTGGTLQYKLDNGSYSTSIPKATDAGEYTVYYKVIGDDNYFDVEEKSVSVTISKATPTVTAPTVKTLTYNKSAQELVNAGSTTGGTLQYKLDSGTYSTNIPTATDVKTYTVYYKVVGDKNYNDVEEKNVSVTISKANPTVTAPKAKENLTYNETEQELIEPGSTTGGTLQYSLDNESDYKEDIPKGTERKTYTVYYKVVGDSNYNGVESKSLTVDIYGAAQNEPPAPEKKTITKYSITLKPLEPNENGATPEYKKDDGDWQESNIFKNLTPNKEYTFYTRYAATEDGNYAPSSPSEAVKIKTLKKNSSQNLGSNSGADGNSNGDNNNGVDGSSGENDKTDENLKENKNQVVVSDEVQQIENGDGIANVETKRSGNEIEINITDENGNSIILEDEIILVAECEKNSSRIVAAMVNDDGTIKVIRKSIVRDGKIYVPLNCSAKIRIIDNSKSFIDVSKNYWGNDAIVFASAHELFNGTAPNIFEPETPMSRAMMVQVLHNLEDNPYQAFEKIFDDVNVEDWFAKAVIWASRNNLVAGYDNENFGPNDSIMREQLATILYRYFGENKNVDIDLNFADADQISDYALKSLRWAVENKIVQGKGDNILDPKGLATRAEVAQMFQNLMLNLFYR